MGSHEDLSREVIKEEIKEVIQEQPKSCCVGNRLQGARVEPGKEVGSYTAVITAYITWHRGDEIPDVF